MYFNVHRQNWTDMLITSAQHVPQLQPVALLFLLRTEAATAAPDNPATASIRSIRVLHRDPQGRIRNVRTEVERYNVACTTASAFNYPHDDTITASHTATVHAPLLGTPLLSIPIESRMRVTESMRGGSMVQTSFTVHSTALNIMSRIPKLKLAVENVLNSELLALQKMQIAQFTQDSITSLSSDIYQE